MSRLDEDTWEDADRPEQPRFFQRRPFAVVLPCRESQSPRRSWLALNEPLREVPQATVWMPLTIVGQFFIADEAVDPSVGNSDLKRVLASLDKFRDIRSERWFPEDADKCTIDPNFGDVPDHSQIKHDDFVLANPIGWHFKLSHISCCAEKYLMLGFGCCDQEINRSNFTFSGAPQLGGKRTSQFSSRFKGSGTALTVTLFTLPKRVPISYVPGSVCQQFQLPLRVGAQVSREVDNQFSAFGDLQHFPFSHNLRPLLAVNYIVNPQLLDNEGSRVTGRWRCLLERLTFLAPSLATAWSHQRTCSGRSRHRKLPFGFQVFGQGFSLATKRLHHPVGPQQLGQTVLLLGETLRRLNRKVAA